MYLVLNGLKHYEKDNYKEGCLPNTGGTISIDITFKAFNLEALISQLMDFCNVDDKKSVLINACEDKGRVDIQVIETSDSDKPSESQLELWKKGQFDLYLCDYSFMIYKSEIADINETTLKGFKDYETNS